MKNKDILSGDTTKLIKCFGCGGVSIKRSKDEKHLASYALIRTGMHKGYVCEMCWRKAVLRLGTYGAVAYYEAKLTMMGDSDNVS